MERLLTWVLKNPVQFIIISSYLLFGEACLLELAKPKVAFYYFLACSGFAAIGLVILLARLTKELTEHL